MKSGNRLRQLEIAMVLRLFFVGVVVEYNCFALDAQRPTNSPLSPKNGVFFNYLRRQTSARFFIKFADLVECHVPEPDRLEYRYLRTTPSNMEPYEK